MDLPKTTNLISKNKSGFLLLSSLFVLTTLLIIVSFYLNAIIQNIKVSSILNNGPQAYNLAEAGIQEAIWRLQNDSNWVTNFETIPNWTTTFTRNGNLVSGGSYTVTVANQALADAVITATSTLLASGAPVQRVVETNVFKALNESPTSDIALFSNGGIESIGSAVNITGEVFTNQDMDALFFSDWNVSGNASSVEDVYVDFLSSLTAAHVYDRARPPAPIEITMPQIDFDSNDPNSYKSRANQIYNVGQFSQLLNSGPVVLNGITYVTGNVQIKKSHNLTINGILVADGYIKIGNGFASGPNASVTVNHNGSNPSGLLSKGNVIVGGYGSTVNVAGLIYAGGNFTVQDGIFQTVNFTVNGGIIAQDSDFFFSWDSNPVNITLNNSYITQALGGSTGFSPILLIRHWEEEY